ncbi:MAG: RING finger protein [Oscillospiraceae bacterium]
MKMASYIGERCIYCNEVFQPDADIVVCPECGTPYHRACYEEEGACINDDLHESGMSWNALHSDRRVVSDDVMKCPRCGTENPPAGIFCKSCGLPLGQSDDARPFNEANQTSGQQPNPSQFDTSKAAFDPLLGGDSLSPETEIDGIKVREFGDYIGPNRLYFLSIFLRYAKFGAKLSINFGAMLFPFIYPFYRKMYKPGVILLLLSALLYVPQLLYILQHPEYVPSGITLPASRNFSFINSELFYRILMAASMCVYGIMFVSATNANKWYYAQAKKTIRSIKEKCTDEAQCRTEIARRGGTSVPAVLCAFAGFFVLMYIALAVYKFI